MKTIYIAGPMRGIPYFNFPAFDTARDRLLAQGWNVVSPADLDRDAGFDAMDLPEDTDWNDLDSLGFSLKEAARRDLDALVECDAIHLLKDWHTSKGACAELGVAEWLRLRVDHWKLRKEPYGKELYED